MWNWNSKLNGHSFRFCHTDRYINMREWKVIEFCNCDYDVDNLLTENRWLYWRR
jgi:hypothetical protein